MKLLIVALILSVLSCSSTPTTPTTLANSTIKRDDGSTVDYYLQESFSTGRVKTLLLALQGSDCNSVKHDVFLQRLAHAAWPSADFLFIEKRGITANLASSPDAERPDCPAEYLQHDNPQRRVDDIKLVLGRVLRDRNYQNVIAMGGSEGAWIAAMYSAETGIPHAVVLINGGGQYFLDSVLHNIKTTTPNDKVESELNGFKGFASHILASEQIDIEVSNHGYQWWRNMLSIDYQSVLSRINAPIFIAQAGRDQAVSPDAVADMINDLRTSGSGNIEYVVYPDLDHALKNAKGVDMADQLMHDVNSWLKSTLSPGSPIR